MITLQLDARDRYSLKLRSGGKTVRLALRTGDAAIARRLCDAAALLLSASDGEDAVAAIRRYIAADERARLAATTEQNRLERASRAKERDEHRSLDDPGAYPEAGDVVQVILPASRAPAPSTATVVRICTASGEATVRAAGTDEIGVPLYTGRHPRGWHRLPWPDGARRPDIPRIGDRVALARASECSAAEGGLDFADSTTISVFPDGMIRLGVDATLGLPAFSMAKTRGLKATCWVWPDEAAAYRKRQDEAGPQEGDRARRISTAAMLKAMSRGRMATAIGKHRGRGSSWG